MRIWTRVRGTIAVVALLFVPVSFAGPQHHRKVKSGGEADINAIGIERSGTDLTSTRSNVRLPSGANLQKRSIVRQSSLMTRW